MSAPTDVHVLAFDLGTGGCKAVLVSADGQTVAEHIVVYPTTYPQTGRHEQRPDDWWTAVVEASAHLLDHTPVHVGAIALSGHSLAMVPLDHEYRTLLGSVPIWSDTRGDDASRTFFETVDEEEWYLRTGNGFPPGLYTVFKITWFARECPDLWARTRTVVGSKDWINLRLTGVVATDPSYASGSGAYDLRKRVYDLTILDALGVPADLLPPIRPSREVIGPVLDSVADELGVPRGTPVVTGGVDNACMALGAGLDHPGAAYLSLGSSNWVSRADHSPVLDARTRPFVFDHVLPDLFVSALSTFGGGSTVSWLAATVNHEKALAQLLADAATCPIGAGGLTCVPTLAGGTVLEGGPAIRGAFLGLELGHGPAHLARATIEGIAFSLEGAARHLYSEGNLPDSFAAVGGGAKGGLLLEILADVLDRPLHRTAAERSCAAVGAAALGFLGIGVWKDTSVLAASQQATETIAPSAERRSQYGPARNRFTTALDLVRQFAGIDTAMFVPSKED